MPRVPAAANWAFPVIAPERIGIGGLQLGAPGIGGLETYRQSLVSSDRMLSNAFAQIDGAANQIEELGNSLHNMSQQSTLNSQQLSFYEKLNDIRLKYSERTDYGNLEDDFKKETSELTKDYGKGLTGPYMEKFRTSMLSDVGKAYVEVKKRVRDGQIDSYRASLIVAEDYHSRRAAEGNKEVAEAHKAEFQQKVYGAFAVGAINEIDLEAKNQKFNERVDLIRARKAITKDPSRVLLALSNPEYYKDLDPMQREQMKEHARARMEQEQMAWIRDNNRAEAEYKKRIRKNGAAVMAEAASGGITIDQLRDLLHSDEINITDYNHARTLIKDFSSGADRITNQDSYFNLYKKILDGITTDDDIVNAKDVNPADKIKLLERRQQKLISGDITHQPDYKNDVKIIEANVKVTSLFGSTEPKFAMAYAYAVSHYDARRREGVDRAIARQEAIDYYKTDLGSDFMPIPMFGNAHEDVKELALRTKQKLDDGSITQKVYNDEIARLIQIKRMKDAKLLAVKTVVSK